MLCSCLQSCQCSQITKLFHFSVSPVLEAGSCLPAWARAAASSSCACRAWSWCQSSTCARSWRTSKHSVTRQVFTAGSTSLSDQKLMGSGQVKYRVSQKHSQDLTLIFSAITWSVFTSSTIFWILIISVFQQKKTLDQPKAEKIEENYRVARNKKSWVFLGHPVELTQKRFSWCKIAVLLMYPPEYRVF